MKRGGLLTRSVLPRGILTHHLLYCSYLLSEPSLVETEGIFKTIGNAISGGANMVHNAKSRLQSVPPSYAQRYEGRCLCGVLFEYRGAELRMSHRHAGVTDHEPAALPVPRL